MSQIPPAGRRPALLRFAAPFGVLAALAAALPALGQTADDLYRLGRRDPAAGARMAALGGTAVAGLGDWTAASVNPAGLAYLEGAQLVGAVHAFDQDAERVGTFGEANAQGFTLSALGGAVALPVVRGALAFGAGYRETAAYERAVGGGRFTAIERQEWGWQGEVSVAGAVALTPRLMGGLAVNTPVGRYRRAGLDPHSASDTPWFDADLYGVNVRGGLSLAFDYGVRLGLAVETPTYLRAEQVPRARLGAAAPPRDVAMTTPWRFALGFLAGSPHALVMADVEVVDWAQARFDADGDPALLQENAFADAAFRTVINSRVGAEGRLGPVALRVGAAFQPDPRFDGPVPEAVWQQYAVGIGVAVHPQARLDVAFVHTRDEDPFLPFEGERGVRNALQVGVDVRF